ncbi:MAG: type II secretion system protein [Phycisphaerae bacterium]
MSDSTRPSSMRRRCSAFTLVELLVVIAIIAVLISILLPVLQKARASALDVVCKSNARQIAMAQFEYASDNRGTLRPGQGMASGFEGDWAWAFSDARRSGSQSLGYITGATRFPRLYACPESDLAMRKIGAGWDNRNSSDPEINFRYWPSYTFPAWTVGNKSGPVGTHFWRRMANTPSWRVLMVEKLSGKPISPHQFIEGQMHLSPSSLSGGMPQYKFLDSGFLDFRHSSREQMNLTIVDGHVRSVTREEIAREMFDAAGRDAWLDRLE